jgi:hypothetical protein
MGTCAATEAWKMKYTDGEPRVQPDPRLSGKVPEAPEVGPVPQ